MQGCNNMTKTVRLRASFYLTFFLCQTVCILARPSSTDANPKPLNLNPLDRRPQSDILTFETENAQQNRRGEHKPQQSRVVNGERTAGMSKTENRPNEERSQLDFHDASQYEGSYVPAHPHGDQDDRRYSEITESSGEPARQRQLTRAKTPNNLPLDNEGQHTTSEIQDNLLNDYDQRNVVANDSQKDLSMTESSVAENESIDRSQHNESVRDEPKSETKDVPENQISDDTKNEVWRLVHTAKHDRDDVQKHYEHDVSVTGSQSEHDVSATGSQNEHDVSVTGSQSEYDVSVPERQNERDPTDPVRQSEHDLSVPGRQTERNANSSAVTRHNTSKPKLKPGTQRSSISRNTTHPIHKRPNPAGQKTQDWQDNAEDMTEDQKDDCELKQLRCSPFYMSPCDKVNAAPGLHYSGHCRVSRHTAEKRWKPCGGVKTAEGRSACFCSGRAASCCANLTAIPDLSINNTNKPVLYLNFTNNNVTVLTKDFLRNNTQLTWLVLNRNNISLVHNDSLEDMRKLHRFELAFNKFKEGINPFNFVSAINTVRSLQVLDLNKTHFARAKPRGKGITWIVRHLRLPHLKQLFIGGGQKRTFYLSDLDPARLPKLCKFSIKSHFLEKVYCCSVKSIDDSMDYDDDAVDQYDAEHPYTDSASGESSCISPESRHEPYCRNFALPNLRLLVLANNSLVRIPSFCKNGSQESVVPNLFGLSLAINAVVHPQRLQFQCLPSLLTMALTGNPLKYIQSNLFQELVSLQEVDLRFTNVMIAEKYAFNHSQLKMVTIESSNWFIDQHHQACCISPLLFEGTNLDIVDLSYNNFRFADNVTIETFLSPLRSVRKLKMADVGLYKIPEIIQRYFRNLEFFDFERNMLSQIPRDIFDNMANLVYLDLSDNHLANPPAETLRTLVVDRNVCVDLQWNPFSCTCDLLEFLDLFKAHRERRRPHDTDTRSHVPSRLRPALKGCFKGDQYHCYAPESVYNHSLQSLELTVHMCVLSVTQELIVLIVCVLIIFCVLTYTLLYKYRWQVRFWLYTLHVRLTRPQSTGPHVQQPRHPPRFNAFVSYCKDDSHFVLTKVLPILERNSRLPLCIHERDFIPGRYISQNVVERMEESKHILLILSNAFLQNDWCRFELFVAQKYGLIHRQIPVTTLVLENLRVDLMDAHVITLLQARPGIEWPGNDNPRDLANFWVHLAQTLGSRPAPIGDRIRPGHDRARPGQDRDRPRHDRA